MRTIWLTRLKNQELASSLAGLNLAPDAFYAVFYDVDFSLHEPGCAGGSDANVVNDADGDVNAKALRALTRDAMHAAGSLPGSF